jgi:hypothetical protein
MFDLLQDVNPEKTSKTNIIILNLILSDFKRDG